MSQITYEASVYSRTVSYTNFNGETKSVDLTFALDPLQLLRVMASIPTPKASKSKNPAQKARDESMISDEQQLKFLVDLASKAAGFISDDGESFEPFEDFADSIAGKAFITKLAASDGDREEFAQKVVVDPFEAFVNYAKADSSNSPAEVKQFEEMLETIKRLFLVANDSSISPEDRRAKLERELADLDKNTSTES